MRSTLHCFGMGVVLFSLAPSTMSFSRGASHTSCQDMIPGHIRAQPQDPRHSYVTLRTSASSYLPGQFITVNVRSSRDFMGFLLQARSVAVAGERAGARVGARARSGVGTGVGSTRVGLGLVGGAWTLTPPGTHTLRCLSEGDTLTHSDKQLKRNLSFVWRAPDAPMGDIRFFITVVQSYFVYWADIESAVVHDGSHRFWSGSKTTRVDGGSTPFALQEDEVSALADVEMERKEDKIKLQDQKLPTVPQTKDTMVNTQTTTSKPSSNHSFLNTNPPGLINRNSREPIQDQTNSVKFETQSSSWSRRLTESQMSLIKDQYGSHSPSPPHNFHLKSFLYPQTSSHKPFFQVQPLPSKPPPQSQTGTSQTFLFSQTAPPKAFPQFKISLPNSTLQSRSPTPRSILQSHTISTLSQTASTQQLLTNTHFLSYYKSLSDITKSQPVNSPSGPKTGPRQTSQPHLQLQTTVPLRSPPQPQRLSSYPQAFPQTITSQTRGFPQTDQSQSNKQPEALSTSPHPWSQPSTQTGAPKPHHTEWKQTQSSLTPRSMNPLPFTSGFDTVFAPNEGKGVTNHLSQAKIKTISLMFAISSTKPSPNFSGSILHSTLQSPSSTPTSTLNHPSSATPLKPLRGSTLVSIHPSFRSTLFTRSSSSSMKNQPITSPALPALPSPSPISVPPHFPSAQPPPTFPLPSSNSSNYLSPTPLFSPAPLSNPSSPPFTSSKSYTGLAFSPPSSSAHSPSPTSSTASSTSSISSASSSLSPPPFTTTPSSVSLGSLSSFISPFIHSFSISSQSTSPYPGPSPVPLRALYNLFMSSPSPAPSQKRTLEESLQTQNHIAPSDPESDFTPATQRTVVHPNPEPHPNLDQNFKLNLGHGLKPNLPNSDTKLKRPSNPSGTPNKEGKYPDIVPRHSAWELGMLLGCSAGLGMVLVVGVRYIYRQSCGKRTEVTLNDREREYERGERGLIHVQECGDLVRVRKIRENSFMLLAEYDILASPAD
ncbi:mucin-5AC-like [Scophthalmus maximus]|uniref:mucin-5AC-like n=1 Tax=Scophthalmus maximus TaxID=52904 RepID=UPI001FA884B7|nr:mucin-5AC-like [Scophthalmus maximus]